MTVRTKTIKLPPKQELFCNEFVATDNATQSYFKLYSCTLKPAESNSALLIRTDKVKKRLKQLRAGVAKRLEITQDRVGKEYAKVAFANIKQFLEFLLYLYLLLTIHYQRFQHILKECQFV